MDKTLNKTATKSQRLPIYKKYAKNAESSWLDPSTRLKPSDLSKPSLDVNPEDYPLITQFNNIMDNTVQAHCMVDIDQPIFEPSPKIVVFEDYEPFSIVKKKLFFRNKDSVGRRIRLIKPDTPYFEISAPQTISGEPLKQSKIAAGMEVCFIVTFRPQEVREYSWDLVCATEREDFLVPLRAIGLRPLLSMPDEVDFGPCPIKSASEKKVVIQNVGTSVAKFNFVSMQSTISCPEQDIVIEAGGTYALELQFTPLDTSYLNGELEMNFANGVKCYIALKGLGKNVEVSLSTPSLTLEPSYISLFSQKTLKIRNLSDAPIRYRWKSFSTEDEEEAERERLLAEINRIEDEERADLQQRVLQGFYNQSNNLGDYGEVGFDLSINENDPTNGMLPFAARVDEAVLIRKYRNLRKALECDKMLFVDDIFDISPMEGEVWAHSEMEITVCFRPDTAALFNCLAYLDVSGRHDRLALQLTGQGIGPHAALSFEVLDIGDIFVNDENFYELSIKNKGDIPAQWTFMSSLTKFGNKFQFSPSEGYLLPNQSQSIKIRFESDILGEFSEYFRFALQGNEDMLICQIKGHVIGPTFHFDCNSIDFGTVSYDYLHSTSVRLVNSSKIPMVYTLHIPQDGAYLKKEFNIEPNRGTLAPKESVEVLIEFIPTTVKVYDYSLAVDVLGVGDILLSIPITAECIVSAVKLDLPLRELDFGDCFIRYPYEQDLKLTNISTVVHTKFEILPQPKQTLTVASYETVPSVAVIEPGDSIIVKVRLIGQKLGTFKVPLTITVAGSQEPPMQAVLVFNTVGPKVAMGCTELKWGNIECLKDSERKLTITNIGLISASMKLFLKMARSCYRIEVQDLVLEAQQSYDLSLIANLDDSTVNKDELHCVVDEGENLMVPLVAKGIGTTMFCKQPIDVLDLGVQLTNVHFEKQIVLENKGRRPQQLRWINKTVQLENSARLAKAKKLGKDLTQKLPKNLAPVDPCFTISPMEITLRSRTATTFTIKGHSPIPRSMMELFVMESKVGKDRNFRQIMQTEVHSEVVNPLLEFSTNNLDFIYVWEKDVEAQIQKKELIFTNTSSITLTFVLKTEIPFNLNTWEITLQPGETTDILVEFDPLYRDDRQSHVVQKALQINYRGHPQKDVIQLSGDVVFPNLKFDLSTINFGCVLNDTSKTLKLKAENSCKIDVKYEWIFLEQSTAKGKQRNAVFATPPSHIFDILPVNSVLHPGESEDVEFTMLSTSNMKLQTTVVCVVEGGPEYKFPIQGESSNVAFELDRSVIDFGKVTFTDKADQELTITNHGRVAYNFKLEPSSAEDAQFLEFIPASGKVAANQQLKVIVRFHPGLPKHIKASFTAHIAHFDPVTIDCYGQGIFPSAIVSLPRYRKTGPFGETESVNSAMWEAFYAQVTSSLMQPDHKLLPPPVHPSPASGSTTTPPSYVEPDGLFPPMPPSMDDMSEEKSQFIGQQSLASTTKGLAPNLLDVEMQRTSLCQLLEDKVASLKTNPTAEDPVLLKDYISKFIELKTVVAARYVCDFGNVIIGQTKKKIFKITNASLLGQLTWFFDKKFLAGTGYSIEPEKVMKLPEGGSIDFTVKYFARTQQKIGPKTYVLPLEAPGSPTIHIVLTANVCLPEIDLSSEHIDFGKILVGRCAKMYVALKNPSPVTALWNFRRTGGRDETRFSVIPSSGSLRPNKKVIVCIEFIPHEAHKCVGEFAIRIDQNKKSKSFKVVGEGVSVPLKFDPTNVEISPVLPFSEGGEQIVTIQNPTDYPVEFFSIDFDTQFKEEENMLSSILDFDSNGLFRTELRVPGSKMPKEVIDAHQKAMLELETPALSADNNNIVDVPAAATLTEGEASSEMKTEDQEVQQDVMIELRTPPIRTKQGLRDEKKHQDIVVVGAPLSGVSTLASSLSRKLLIPIRKIDEMLLDVAAVDHEFGVLARKFTGRSTASEQSQMKEKEDQLRAIAEQSKIDAAEAYKKEKKGKAKEIPDEVYDTPQVRELQDYLKSFEASVESLVKIFTFRGSWSDIGDGMIIDGMFSEFIPLESVGKVLEESFPDIMFTHIKINREQEGYLEWIHHIHSQQIQEIERLKEAMKTNKRYLIKTFKAVKGKTVDQAVKELEASFADGGAPEALPSGDESWLDVNGKIIELDGNDYKALEEKEKTVYLRQILYFHNQLLLEAEQSMKRIQAVLNINHSPRVEIEGEQPTEAGDVAVVAAEGEAKPDEGVVVEGVEAGVAQEAVPAEPKSLTYEQYVNQIVPSLAAMKIRNVNEVEQVENGTEEVKAVDVEEEKKTEEVVAPEQTEGGEEATADVVTAIVEEPVGGVYEIALEGDESPDVVQQLALSQLPAPKVSLADRENELPGMEVFQIYRKPLARPNRKAIKNFVIVDINDILVKPTPPPPVVEVVPEPVNAKGGKKPPAKAKEEPVVVEPVVVPEVVEKPPPPTRWVVEPQSTVQFKVRFTAEKEASFSATMEFEVVGTGQKFSLPCAAICEYPKVNIDTRNVFMRRLKALNPANPHPPKRFVIAENFYSFGSLALFKKPEWKKAITDASSQEDKDNYAAIESTNSDIVRITNNGRYRCEVNLGVDYEEGEPKDVFQFEPATFEIDEGETKEVRAWALPKEGKQYKGTMAINVAKNPTITTFPLSVWGSDPTADLIGPWSEALTKAEEALAKNTDKKAVKDLEAKLNALKEAFTIDFDRVLLGKNEVRTFTIKNTSLIPVAFEISPDEFENSSNITIAPLSGVIPYNSSTEISVTFTSPTPLMLTGKFSLKYSDSEGGLKTTRAMSRTFRAVAEAYAITAVSLNSEGTELQGTSELDFGLVRVGDYAVQTLKMGNKGKYKIGYAFEFKTPAIADLVKIEPMEGTIETGNALAEIKVTFCAKAGEILLKSNSDIIVHISEPETKEIVEKFPLLISAQSKYNRFRLQPSKGISFGAIRFDADPRVKRAELRNESKFEVTYVVLPVSAEHDEIDDLDGPAFAAYACGCPAAMRAKELGDGYLKKAGGGGGDPGKGKKDAKPPAKGKGAVEAPPVSTLNPLVQDPDNLTLGTIPNDPLVVGAFTVHPRIATIQPGQAVSIDMKFDPSGCETTVEKLRICVSGADPADPLTVTLKSFELIGESCLPAIVANDPFSIFEEQEIVSSLAESTGENSTTGGKIEKLPVGKVVYAEAEKMLAFGPTSCTQTGRGVMERVKITNPTKIDIKVKFKVLSTEAAAALSSSGAAGKDGKGGKDAKAPAKDAGKGKKGAPETVVVLPEAFTVQPESWEIPPHEHRFVNVYFNPGEIKSYRSVFMAEIDDEGINSSVTPKVANTGKSLMFDLGGSGTLPCISIEDPTERNAEGKAVINFGKTLVERSVHRVIKIRNDGVMPATCLFEITGGNDFVFPARGTSLTVGPGRQEEVKVSFAPKEVVGNGDRTATIRINVLNNAFDQYFIILSGNTYSSDAVIDTSFGNNNKEDMFDEPSAHTDASQSDSITFPDINLTSGPGQSQTMMLLKSRSNFPLKFEFSRPEGTPSNITFSPSVGHLAAFGTREITLSFTTEAPITIADAKVLCSLKKIEYQSTSEDPKLRAQEETLWGKWDDAMKSIRVAYPEDVKAISDYAVAIKEYEAKVEAEKAKGKKGKPVGPPPDKCMLELAPLGDDGQQMVYEIVSEPYNQLVADYTTQQVVVSCNGVADVVSYECQGQKETLKFVPTYIFQTATHRFNFHNKSKIKLPLNWKFEDMNRRKNSRQPTANGTTRALTANTITKDNLPCPYAIEPEECVVGADESKEFTVKFAPMDAGDFLYNLQGTLFPDHSLSLAPHNADDISMVFHGLGKRPVCHFDIKETLDYLSRRESNLKNENGLNSSIETPDLKIVEVESVGLKTRNTFRFYVTNTTNESYEFSWEPMGEASPFWRCVQAAGMMFPGKRIEMIFEYLPEDTHVSEAFFKFRLPKVGLQQIFLFAGKVNEPKVAFSTSKLDFHSVLLGGEGITETIYLENQEHLPFNYSFDKYSLMQLEGPQGPVLHINPKEGTVPPHGKVAVQLFFKPQEEVVYNYNVVCMVKRKPNKLSINIKGEGYAVHPQIQLEQTLDTSAASVANGTAVLDKFLTLKPLPATNIADFGSVQVLDSLAKSISVLNAGKYNFDYSWNIDHIGSMLALTGGKLNGTLLKGEELSYKLTFAPQAEGNLDQVSLKLTVAGKYVYQIIPKGVAVKPALRFSFMHHDFGNCFITSPGGSTVIEEAMLVLKNHDPSSNISVECVFQKIRALWVECAPTVIPPGGELQVPIRFAPREVKEYSFSVPFMVNGTGRVNINVLGKGINARLELVSGSQRRTAFGLVNVGTSASRTVMIVNKSKKALPIQLLEGGEYGKALTDRCISYAPLKEVILAPKQTLPVVLDFKPTKRVFQFSEDLLVQYAGVTRTLVSITGKAQGIEVGLDSDSIPYGLVVLDSQKVKKLTLENTGDLTVNFHWQENTFGEHFRITPLVGKLLPGTEVVFDVIFKPKFVDEDIRQDNMTLMIPGIEPLKITCSGMCINPPTENIQTLQFQSLARKNEVKVVKISNPTEKDWFLSPSLQGIDWKVPYEFKVPAKGSGDLPITYYPLTMATGTNAETNAPNAHHGKLFVALPDGSAQLYELRGTANNPECSGKVDVETPAKKAATVILKIQNWLGEMQKFNVSIDINTKPCPATFVIAANATEVGPNGTKEFPIRFVSYMEGTSKATITFTNPDTNEYCFYELTAKTTMSEVLEVFTVEAPVRQTARAILTLENPLSSDIAVTMGSVAKPAEWWTCDSKFMRVNELSSLSGNHEGTFEVEFRPLVPTPQPTEHLVTIITQELGTFKYKIIAKATPPLLKQTLRFGAPLGGMQAETFLFRAFNTAKVDFQCSVRKSDFFTVQKALTVEPVAGGWEGDDIRLPVNFEPTEIGEFRDTLILTSPDAGSYECELIGTCIPPTPQGPFQAEQGMGPVEITFRNCFTTACNWTCSIDSTAFRISTPAQLSVNPKTEAKCAIVFEPKEDQMEVPGGYINAKLFISCASKPAVPSWVYYIRGKVNKAAAAAPVKGKK